MNNYPNPYQPQQPPQPPRELARAQCVQGKLIVTDHLITLGRAGNQRSMARASLVGVDYKLTAFFPGLSRARLTFHGAGGERMVASSVSAGKAKQIKRMLGF